MPKAWRVALGVDHFPRARSILLKWWPKKELPKELTKACLRAGQSKAGGTQVKSANWHCTTGRARLMQRQQQATTSSKTEGQPRKQLQFDLGCGQLWPLFLFWPLLLVSRNILFKGELSLFTFYLLKRRAQSCFVDISPKSDFFKKWSAVTARKSLFATLNSRKFAKFMALPARFEWISSIFVLRKHQNIHKGFKIWREFDVLRSNGVSPRESPFTDARVTRQLTSLAYSRQISGAARRASFVWAGDVR